MTIDPLVIAWMQTCIVHQIGGSIRCVTYTDRKAVARDLKPVYRAVNADAALQALEALARRSHPPSLAPQSKVSACLTRRH